MAESKIEASSLRLQSRDLTQISKRIRDFSLDS
jgi:hypothetical protein